MNVSNPLNLLQGKPIASNCNFQDGGIAKVVNGYGDYSHLGTGNTSWKSDNAQAITGLSGSAIGTIRVWCDPFTPGAPRVAGEPWYAHIRGMSGFSFKSSTTDWSSNPLGGTYETDLGDHALPLAVTTGVLPTGWTSVGANDDPSWLFYYDITVNAPVGTKSLWFHMDAPSPTGTKGAQDLNEIQAFPPPPAPPVVAITSPLESASVPASFTINATATDEGSVTSVTFFIDDVQIGDPDTSPPYSVAMVGATPGARVLTAKALDNDSNLTTSAPVNITVTPTNQAPVATAHLVDHAAGR